MTKNCYFSNSPIIYNILNSILEDKADAKIQARIREGRVLPPLLRSLQLLLQRPETKIVIRPKISGILGIVSIEMLIDTVNIPFTPPWAKQKLGCKSNGA